MTYASLCPSSSSSQVSQDKEYFPEDLTPNPYSYDPSKSLPHPPLVLHLNSVQDSLKSTRTPRLRRLPRTTTTPSPSTTSFHLVFECMASLHSIEVRRSFEHVSPLSPTLNSSPYHSSFNSSRASQAFTYLNPPPSSPYNESPYPYGADRGTMSVPCYATSRVYSSRISRPVRSMTMDPTHPYPSYMSDLYTDPSEVFDASPYPSSTATTPNAMRTETHSSLKGSPIAQNVHSLFSTNLNDKVPHSLLAPPSTGSGSYTPSNSAASSASPTLSSTVNHINKEGNVIVIPKWVPNNRSVCKTLQDLVEIADESMMNILLSDVC